MKDKVDLYVGRKIPEQNTQERINKTLTEMASKFCFTSSHYGLPHLLQGAVYERILSAGASQKMERSFTFRQLHFLQGYVRKLRLTLNKSY